MFRDFILWYSAFVQTKRGKEIIIKSFIVLSAITYIVVSGVPAMLWK